VPEVHFVEQVPREALQASSASHAVVLGCSHELRARWPRAQWTPSASNPQGRRSAAGRPRCCCACSLQAPSGLRGEGRESTADCKLCRAPSDYHAKPATTLSNSRLKLPTCGPCGSSLARLSSPVALCRPTVCETNSAQHTWAVPCKLRDAANEGSSHSRYERTGLS
jgi:hypothetical protein